MQDWETLVHISEPLLSDGDNSNLIRVPVRLKQDLTVFFILKCSFHISEIGMSPVVLDSIVS